MSGSNTNDDKHIGRDKQAPPGRQQEQGQPGSPNTPRTGQQGGTADRRDNPAQTTHKDTARKSDKP